ncbi:MAG TPA: DUF3300 domain-containing protein [Terracidiphilus sp.]|nr:DUF3300 domain-containing protein [Terracidiphilus sp.]
MALILLPLAQVELFAQQGSWQSPPQYGQYGPNPYTQGSPRYEQYAPNQQPADGQPNYPQPGYGQPQPSRNQYGQQSYDTPPYVELDRDDSQPGYGPSQPAAQPFTAEQLEQMLAPIALYPDAMLAQVLAAATYPAQVAVANQWLRSMGNAPSEQIAAGADAQNWDPSVKALTAFPQVLAQMDQDLSWTTDLGNAYYNQPQDVLQTVQVMRKRAQAAGNLQSTPQESVTEDQGNIELAPPDPNTAYVPSYNPWNVYGNPVQPYPGFSLLDTLGSIFGSSPIQYGLGIAMAAFNHTPFGWLSWALDWLGNGISFNHSNYYSQSTSVAHWGYGRGSGYADREWAGRSGGSGAHGGGRFDQPRGDYGREGSGWNRGQDRNRESFRDSDGYPSNGYPRNRTYAGNGFADGRSRGYLAAPGYQREYGRGNGYGYEGRYGGSYVRPALPQQFSYNRAENRLGNNFAQRPQGIMPARPQPFITQRYNPSQSFARPAYGSGFLGGGSRSGGFSSPPQQNWRAPQRGSFGQQSFSPPRSSFFGRNNSGSSYKPEHSGGFHLFGGGHSSSHSFSAPHFSSPKAPKSFGGGGHGGGGGGHSSSHGSWGHHH